MASLPTGTVTFLFTDIEGSTKLWERYPEAMRTALAKHDEILRQAVKSNFGQVVKTTGDGLHAVFETALSAATAAFAAQQALLAETWEEIKPMSVRARMGLHTCEAEVRAGDYYGSAVNRAARLMLIGHGGQILLSNATAELIREGLPPEASLRDLGERRLKDLARPERVYQLVHPALPADFPPLTSLDSIPNNLPVQLTSFVGREKESIEINRLLDTARLVTLTGSGGTGKTRLAQEVSAHQLMNFPNGAWLIELAPLRDPSQIVPTIAQVFGLQELPAKPLADMVVSYLSDKKALIILDNCEHLIEACARLADDLLHHCPQIKIIASSREALGIAGEVAYRIPSLQESEAVQLFEERARATNAAFRLTGSNAPAVARICYRLDGIPLAIELAAARTRLLSPEQIAARLDDRFRLLVGGSRTALPRQQTLRALIDWSYDLLSQDEKRLLRVSSIFVGGWTLEALETVADDPATLEHLEQLVNKSLVVTEEGESEMRYSQLETIRQYAREKLLDSGADEAVRTRDRHLDFYIQLLESSEPRLSGPEMIASLNELEVEQGNFRAALEWASDHDLFGALRITAVLHTFWARRGPLTEGYNWVKETLARSEDSMKGNGEVELDYQRVKAKTLAGEAGLALSLGENFNAQTAIEACVSLARQINDTKILAYALSLGSTIFSFLGNVETAGDWSHEALALSRKYGYLYEEAMSAGLDMFLALISNRPVPSGLMEETIRISRISGNPWALGMAISNAGRVARNSGDEAQALNYFLEAAELFSDLKDRMMFTSVRSEIGHLYRQRGRYAEAEAIYRETLPIYKDLSHYAAVAHQLESFAFIAAAQGQPERAAVLLGAAEALRERIASEMTLIERREYDGVVSQLRDQMDAAAFANAWARGRAMTMEQAIQVAFDRQDQ